MEVCEVNSHSSIEWQALHSYLDIWPKAGDASTCDARCVGYTFLGKSSWTGDDVLAFRCPDGHEFATDLRGEPFKRMEAMDAWGRPTGASLETQPWVPVGRMRSLSAALHPDAYPAEEGLTYEGKPVHHFLQFDGWTGLECADDQMVLDGHADLISEGPALDRRTSGADLAVRIQIHEGVRRSDALRLLRKTILMLEEMCDEDVPLEASFGCCTKVVNGAAES